MVQNRTASKGFAVLLGMFLAIAGLWGLFRPVVFGVLTTNPVHAVIHLLLGGLGMWTAFHGGSRMFCSAAGLILLTVGFLRLVPATDDLIVALLNVNLPAAYFNIAIGGAALLIALLSPSRRIAD